MKLNDRDLELLHKTHDEHLQDLCDILHYEGVEKSPRGAIVVERGVTEDVPCGFTNRSRKYLTPDMTIVTIDGTLRLSLDTSVDAKDMVRITKRYGQEVEPVEYELDGAPVRGSAGVVVGVIRKRWAD